MHCAHAAEGEWKVYEVGNSNWNQINGLLKM